MRLIKAFDLLAGASAMAVAVGAHGQEVSQTKPPSAPAAASAAAPASAAPAAPGDKSAGEIVVTGTLIANSNYRAPTPVTVMDAGDLQKASPVSVVAGVQQLPQFSGSVGRQNYAQVQQVRGQFLNLRNLGAVRTLTMVDGIRIPANTYNGQVDVSVIPSLLVKRVDVVTAGASAAYGSDAVAGVVNFILDDKFDGVKGDIQNGISTYGDYHNWRAAVAAGFQVTGNLHLTLSYEHEKNGEIRNEDRPFNRGLWASAGANPGAGTAGTASNPLVPTANTTFGRTESALITSPGSLQNIYFPTVGTYRMVNFGTPTGSSGIYQLPSDYVPFDQSITMVAPSQSDRAYGRLDYDVSSNVSAYVMVMASFPRVQASSTNYALTGNTIYSGNPYIPAGLQQTMTAQNIQSFTFNMGIHGFPLPYETYKGSNWTVYGGLKGSVADRFNWTLNYTHAQSILNVSYPTLNNRKVAAALDAVTDPATDNIVCRVTLTNPGLYPGCVPMNVMGVGAISQAAYNYVLDDSTYRSLNRSDMVEGRISGKLFEGWAGPISGAIGADYRSDSLDLSTNSDPSTILPITGLRGISATAPIHYNLNQGAARGSDDVKEAFGEIQIPVLRDSAVGKSLDLNGAVRYTNYATSGGVTTWKAGGTYKPIDGVTFRVTRSHDIRAPNLYELYAGAQGSVNGITDPHTNQTFSVTTYTGGNPNLKPEVGDTITGGIVLQPAFIPGFSMSVDYYKIKIRGAIGTLSAQAIVSTCEATGGTDPSCALITRPHPYSDTSADNFPTQINVVPANLAVVKENGIDFEASYRRSLANGDFSAHFLMSYLNSYKTQSASNQPYYQQAGYGSPTLAFTGGLSGGLPKVKANLDLAYDADTFGVFVEERMIGSMKIGNAATVYDYPKIPAVFYTNMTLTARPKAIGRFGGELYLTVTNLFNKQPPIIGPTNGGLPYAATDPTLYDVIGRTFTAGFRFKFK